MQFGVIHDGKNAYEGAVEAVQALQRKGKKVSWASSTQRTCFDCLGSVALRITCRRSSRTHMPSQIVIISNSSRRQGDTTERLRRMGFGPFTDEEDASPHELTPICVITSGDLVWQGLNGQITQNMQTCADGGEDAADLFSDLGKRCFVFGNGEDDAEYVSTCGREIFPIEQVCLGRTEASALTDAGRIYGRSYTSARSEPRMHECSYEHVDKFAHAQMPVGA
eukprot:1155725-Pleurochrysis_carterae.AAC.3